MLRSRQRCCALGLQVVHSAPLADSVRELSEQAVYDVWRARPVGAACLALLPLVWALALRVPPSLRAL